MSEVSVVITAFDQGELVAEAVASAWAQTVRPARVVVVDDGSSDPASLTVLERLAASATEVLRQANAGVSAARNAGIRAVAEPFVVVLDGDDRLAPAFLARTLALLDGDPEMVAASSWMRTHGVLEAEVRPGGGRAVDFLARNACPATTLLRRSAWEVSGGYDEAMRSGFEDWDLFLSLLAGGGSIGIVPEPLIEYRTSPVSANVRSMTQRLDLYGALIDKHLPLFDAHLREALLALEGRAIGLGARVEDLLIRHPEEPLREVTYGDGGMAAAVRVASARAKGHASGSGIGSNQ
ncbi:glycosyltransferase family 2 protein [Demequina phytophila]|uniref:glycosyltransferase family 2 protein n=1 Tax=Demequina phytophila TaxID=1638981 RepID=UPI0007862786|nr:glycosyltransferase family A protein [Demequina phytophila]